MSNAIDCSSAVHPAPPLMSAEYASIDHRLISQSHPCGVALSRSTTTAG